MATDLCQIAKNVAENVFCTTGLNSYEEALKIFFATFQDGCLCFISGDIGLALRISNPKKC